MSSSLLLLSVVQLGLVVGDGGIGDCGIGLGCGEPTTSYDDAHDWHDNPTPKPVRSPLPRGFILGTYNPVWPICDIYTDFGIPDTDCIIWVKNRYDYCVEHLLEIFGDNCGQWALFHANGRCSPECDKDVYHGDYDIQATFFGRRRLGAAPAPSVIVADADASSDAVADADASDAVAADARNNDFVCNAVMDIAASIKKKFEGEKMTSKDVREGLRKLYKTCDELRNSGDKIDWIKGTQCLLYSELSFRVNHSLVHTVLDVSVDGTKEEQYQACANAVNEVNHAIISKSVSGVKVEGKGVVTTYVESFTSDGEFDLDVVATVGEYHGSARRLLASLLSGSIFVVGTLCNSFQRTMLHAPA